MDEQNPARMRETEVYEIRIAGNLSSRWSDWFEGLTITPGQGNETILSGVLRDQADLHGVLMKIRDLHLKLISVNRILPQEEDRPPVPKSNVPVRGLS